RGRARRASSGRGRCARAPSRGGGRSATAGPGTGRPGTRCPTRPAARASCRPSPIRSARRTWRVPPDGHPELTAPGGLRYPPPSLSTTTGNRVPAGGLPQRIPELDGLRGIAILLVVVWHYWIALVIGRPLSGVYGTAVRSLSLTW